MPDIEINVQDYQNVFSASVGSSPLIQVSVDHSFNTVSVDVVTQNPTVNVDIIGTGPVGPGVSAGGSAGQVLRKASSANYDTEWTDENVSSVNGQTGDVALFIPSAVSELTNDSGYVDAAGAALSAPVQSVNASTGVVVLTYSDVNALPDDISIAKGTDADGRAVDIGYLGSSTVSGDSSVSMGRQNTVGGTYSLAVGYNNTVSGNASVAEGRQNTASGNMAHAEGYNNKATNQSAHVEGQGNESNAVAAHAEGYQTKANAQRSHAEGYATVTNARSAHAEGVWTIANGRSQHVFGEYNVADTYVSNDNSSLGTYAEIVGNGTADNARSNARTLDWSGNETLAGKLTLGADPANNMDAATKQYVDGKIQPVPEAATNVPADLGTAAVGSSAKYALEDHVHNKPTYSASDVGLGNVDNVQQYSASNPPPYPVTSVNGQTGDVTLSVGDTKVEQTYTTTSSYTYWRPVVVGDSAVSTESAVFTTSTAAVRTFTNIRFQPSTGTLKATAFKGDLTGSVTGTASGNLTSSSTLNPANLSGVSTGTTQFLREDGTWATPAYPSVPGAYTSTPSVLGTASAGVSNDYSRGDHVHEMPSASDVGALPDDTKYALSASVGGPATVANGIHYAQVDNTSTSTKFTATIPGITSYYDGLTVMLKNGVVTSASGFTININNLGAKQAYNNMAAATAETTLFNVNYTMLFVYDSTRVAGGGWICYRGYNSDNNTIGYQVRTNSMSLPMTSVVYRYRLLFESADQKHYVPANNSTSTNATAARSACQDPINPFGRIVYYGTTASVAAGSRPSTGYQWMQYVVTIGYSFQASPNYTLTTWKPVYLRCTPQANGSAVIDSSTPFVQDLPTTEDGKIYIWLGVAHTETAFELTLEHPVYCYKGGHVQLWTNSVPTPAEIGAIALPAAPSAGDFLVYNGSSWAAVTMAEWQGGAY